MRKVIMPALLFVVVLVIMSAVAIWLGLGPIVHSASAG
jgi:hypothetical protein